MQFKFICALILLATPLMGAYYERKIESTTLETCGENTIARITLNDGTKWKYYVDLTPEFNADNLQAALKTDQTITFFTDPGLPQLRIDTGNYFFNVSMTAATKDLLPKITDIAITNVSKGWLTPATFLCTLKLTDGSSFVYTNLAKFQYFLESWKVGQTVLVTQDNVESNEYILINMDAWTRKTDSKTLLDSRILDNYTLVDSFKSSLVMLTPPTTK